MLHVELYLYAFSSFYILNEKLLKVAFPITPFSLKEKGCYCVFECHKCFIIYLLIKTTSFGHLSKGNVSMWRCISKLVVDDLMKL